MRYILFGVGLLLLLAVIFVLWRYFATVRASRQSQAVLLQKLAPVHDALSSGTAPAPEDIARFAADPATRNGLFDLLLWHKKLDLFPAPYRTQAALAESDLVVWLTHPNELQTAPDEIKLVERQVITDIKGRRRAWFVFAFRVNPPHWAADKGWMTGVVGPAPEHEAEPFPTHSAFSMFEALDSKSPHDHAAACRELWLKKGLEV